MFDFPVVPAELIVALRKESVDRNNFGVDDRTRGFESLSARRAWIEMLAILGCMFVIRSLSARRAWIEMHISIA